ncbi:MAG: haloalkane dehalogenase [Pseudomonadales bacterium]|jgi:haloalkane dehalogenase|nr:haloalkane dehalogenase [Pseudomonadales bacterium]MDP7357664.1 haloalkane dehalogenase [Pseudomonadales bacterium]MDP7594037.1 haloalkane dehalogenase [Pseudomonadales bacterium]HJN49918.1 haloalkane dehalogenase [Pseudomonadales bacterium]|tara:strand:+ start:157 stop:1041 length:885 start_codon:yes stop_codon:yes gene_type:complete
MNSSAVLFDKKRVEVNGKNMAYIDEGSGDPIVFLHGNPTSSYLWRNIIPHLTDQGRCVAPDLIGMGDSDKLDQVGADSYRFVEHREYLDGLLDLLGIEENVVFVIHDWGSALGFDWANRHRESTQGIAYMEAIVTPMSWDDWPEVARRIFQGFRSDAGEEMILQKNVFVERILPGSIIRDLTDEEMAVYREPFIAPGESRRPTLTWPRQIPLGGEPEDVVGIVNDYAEWLQTADLPKLLINASPGSILTGRQLEFCRSWPNQDEVTVEGIHFIQEDSPDEIGQTVSEFVRRLRG